MATFIRYGIINFYMIFAVVLMGYYAGYSFVRRRSRAHLLFSALCVCVSVYGFGYLMEINVSGYDALIFWNQVQYLGIPFFGPLWLLFNMEYLKVSTKRPRLCRSMLFIIPVTTFMLRLTNSLHGLFYSSVFVHMSGEIAVLGLGKGWWYYVQIVFLTGCVIASAILIIQKKNEYTKIERSVFWTVILVTLIPYLGMLLNLLNIGKTHLDYSAFSLPLVVFLVVFILFRTDFLRLKSYAREAVFDGAGAGIVVLDAEYRIIDYNKAACVVFPFLCDERTDLSIANAPKAPEFLQERIRSGEAFNLQGQKGESLRDFNATISDITSRSGKRVGYILNLADVTETVQSAKKVMEQAEKQRFTAVLSSDIILSKPDSGKDIILDSMKKTGEFFKANRCFVYKVADDFSVAEKQFEWTAHTSCVMRNHIQGLVGRSWKELTHYFHGRSYLIDQGEACTSCPLMPAVQGGLLPKRHTVLIPVYLSGELVSIFGMDFFKNAEELEEDIDYMITVVHIVSAAVINEYIRRKLEQERILLGITLMSVGDGVISTDTGGRVVLANPVAASLTGWTQGAMRGKALGEVLVLRKETPSGMKEFYIEKAMSEGFNDGASDNIRLVSKQGNEIPVELTWAPILDHSGEKAGYVIVCRDFSEKKKRNDMVQYLSFHDQLTSVYNRRFFEIKLSELDAGENLPLSLVMADVNGLKMANDVFGHAFGDKLLQTAANIMHRNLPKGGFLCRIGGDEFLLLLPGISIQEARTLIIRIKEQMDTVTIHHVMLSVSFGCAAKDSKETSIHEVLKRSEEEMYQNKLNESPEMKNKTMDIIIKNLFRKIPEERLHAEAVRDLSEAIGRAMGLHENAIHELSLAAYLHDIGKIAVDESVILYDGVLDSKGMEQIRRHSESGYRMLSTVPEMAHIARIVLAHHENWDGTGYPGRLSGKDIALQSRIIRIADSYDAITRLKSYRAAKDEAQALEDLRKGAGTMYDPELVDVFERLKR